MSFEKDMLRKTAGLPFSTKKQSLLEGKISKIRTLDVETELLRIFSSSIRDVKRLRDIMEGRSGSYYGGISSSYGNQDQYRLKDESGDIDKKYLFKLALEKLDLIEESLRDCFNIKDDVEVSHVEVSNDNDGEEFTTDDDEESNDNDW